MNQFKKQAITGLSLVTLALFGGCVSIESGTISESHNGSTGTIVHSTTSQDGFLEIFGTHKDTSKANKALASQCTNSRLTDVVDQISKRDVLLLVQIYTIRAQGVCLPVAAPAPAPAPIVAPAPPPVVHQLVHAKKTKRGLVFTLGSVLFATNKSNLNENARNSVNELTAYLQDHPTRNIRIEGYTDSTGSKKYNQSLSIRRAKSVEDALLKAGIDKSRMQAKGYGLQFPVATNKTVDGRQLNRRVEVVISDKNGHFLKNR